MNTIKELRLQRGLSQAALARQVQVHQTAVSQWEKGRTSPDGATLRRLAGVFGVSVDYLMGLSAGERCQVPVLGYVRAGLPAEALENVLGYEEISEATAASGEHFALRISGNSMEPRFCDGDTVIVRRQSEAESGEIAVVMVGGSDATVKKIIKKDNSLVLFPLNPAYEPKVFTGREVQTLPVRIVGKVVELRAKF